MLNAVLPKQNWWKSLEIELEGAELILSNDKIENGDMYVAERNTGPQLLTARDVRPGWIHPVESAYSYDVGECRKVIKINGVDV